MEDRATLLREEQRINEQITVQADAVLDELKTLSGQLSNEIHGNLEAKVLKKQIAVEDGRLEADDPELHRLEVALGQAINQRDLVWASIKNIRKVMDYYG